MFASDTPRSTWSGYESTGECGEHEHVRRADDGQVGGLGFDCFFAGRGCGFRHSAGWSDVEKSADILDDGSDVGGLTRVESQQEAARPERAGVGGADRRDTLGDISGVRSRVQVARVAGPFLEPLSGACRVAIAEDLDQVGIELAQAFECGVVVPPVVETGVFGLCSEGEEDLVAGVAELVSPCVITGAERVEEGFQDCPARLPPTGRRPPSRRQGRRHHGQPRHGRVKQQVSHHRDTPPPALLQHQHLLGCADYEHLIQRIRRGLRHIQYRSDLIDDCLAETGLTIRPA